MNFYGFQVKPFYNWIMKPAPLDMDYETSPPPPLYSEVCILHIRQSDVVLVLRLAYCHLNHALLPMSLNVVPNLNLYNSDLTRK